jgi:hypothetical protein
MGDDGAVPRRIDSHLRKALTWNNFAILAAVLVDVCLLYEGHFKSEDRR